MTPHHSTPGDDPIVWVPCGTCWGQRTVYSAPAGGDRLVAASCPACLGVGERMAGGDHIPAPAS